MMEAKVIITHDDGEVEAIKGEVAEISKQRKLINRECTFDSRMIIKHSGVIVDLKIVIDEPIEKQRMDVSELKKRKEALNEELSNVIEALTKDFMIETGVLLKGVNVGLFHEQFLDGTPNSIRIDVDVELDI
jgi:hypothetical protein